jgi:catechol 2,3-dioxygenase-like lactoylglutathione lyase family enzyme
MAAPSGRIVPPGSTSIQAFDATLPMHMLHHVSFAVVEIERAANFYDKTLAALGYVRVFEDLRPGEDGQAVGYGLENQDDKFCIKQACSSSASAGPGFHLAFAAPSRAAVHEFHEQALLNGGRDNGRPGPRPGYGPNYYACFVIDPDGHRIEAVINGAA